MGERSREMSIITISGNLGAGARDVGRIAARKLGFDYVDREILTAAASALGVDERDVAVRDEEMPPPGLRERLASFFREFLERSAVAGAADPMMGTGGLETLMSATYREAAAFPVAGREQLTDARYKEAITTVMNGLAIKGEVVIVGRGSQVILRDRPDTLHVCITAAFPLRVQRIAEREGIAEDKAKTRVEESEHGRIDFHNKYFKVHPTDPALYDIMVNTGHLSYERAADIIVAALNRKVAAG
jgi:cytidylate kinase